MNFFASIGMPLITLLSTGFATVLNIILNMRFIPEYGIIGASFSSIISYGLMLIISIIYVYKRKTIDNL